MSVPLDSKQKEEKAKEATGLPTGAYLAGVSRRVEVPWLHQLLAACGPETVELRYRDSIEQSDVEHLKLLHSEWFPIYYPDPFYNSLVEKKDRIIVAEAKLENKFHIVGCITFRIKKSKAKFRRAKASDYLSFLKGQSVSTYVYTLGVVPELRGRGVARRLFKEMKEAIRPLELDYVYLDVIEYNRPAFKFYDHLGFTEFRKKQRYYWIEGTYFDGTVLIKYEKESLRIKKPSAIWTACQAAAGIAYRPVRILIGLCKKKRSEKTTSS